MSDQITDNEIMRLAVVLRDDLSNGSAANAASILCMAMAGQADLLGYPIEDAEGVTHSPITKHSVVVLSTSLNALRTLRGRIRDFPNVRFTDFISVAQVTHDDYDGYANSLRQATSQDFAYVGIAVFGSRKDIAKLTGSMKLYR